MDCYNSIFKHYGIPQEIIDEISLWTHKISFADSLDEVKVGKGVSTNNKLIVWPHRQQTRINEESVVFKKDYYSKNPGLIPGVEADTLAQGDSNDVYLWIKGFKPEPADVAYTYMDREHFWRVYEKTTHKGLFCKTECHILCSDEDCPAIIHEIRCQGWMDANPLR